MKTKLLTAFLAGIMILSIGLTACSTDQATGDTTVQMVGQSDVPLFDRAVPDDGALEAIRQNMYDAEVVSLPDMKIEMTLTPRTQLRTKSLPGMTKLWRQTGPNMRVRKMAV